MKASRRRALVSLTAALGLIGLGAPAANAATTVGQTAAPYPGSCGAGQSLVQSTIGSGASYVVPPGGGVITAWQHVGRSPDPGSGRLQLWKPAGGTSYTLAGRSEVQSFAAGLPNSFPTRITVAGGEVLGFRAVTEAGCAFASGNFADELFKGTVPDAAVGDTQDLPGSTGAAKVNVSASLEPDADKDGFGDETQDNCLDDSGTDNGCAPKPKCKKKKKGKKKSAAAAKKKSCKKKKKKKK